MRWLAMLLMLPALGVQTTKAQVPLLVEEDTINITTNFRGTFIELKTYLPKGAPAARLVITGPEGTLTFRTKARRAGLWINAEKQQLSDVPTYIALVGISAADLNARCTTNSHQSFLDDKSIDLSWMCDGTQRQLMATKGLFYRDERPALTDLGNGFYSAKAFLPPTAKPGLYTLQLTARGQVETLEIAVRRAGLERLVLETAQNSRLFYGLLCLVLAALAGWLTNLIFSRRG